MNTHYDELETLVGTELHDRAEDVHGARLTFLDVQGRARRIKRRRQAGAGVAVAAALAIAVPLGLSGGGALDTKERIDPAVPDRQEVVRTTLTTTGLDHGAAPGVEYFTPQGVVLPESGVRPLEENWQALIPSEADGGWLALGPSRDEVVDLTEDFERTSARSVTQSIVSSPDRSLVAWTFIEPGAQTLTLHSTTDPDVGAVWDFPGEPLVEPVGFVSDASLLYETTDRMGRTIEIGIANEDGTTSTLNDTWVGAVSANPETGLVAVTTKSNPDTSVCSGVVDPAASTTETAWDTCDYSLYSFSPDGRYVLASGPQQSGQGRTELSILDARTGALVTSFRPERGTMVTLTHVVWETSDTAVAVATEGNSWTLLRLGVDGRLEEVAEPVDSDAFGDWPFFFGADRQPG